MNLQARQVAEKALQNVTEGAYRVFVVLSMVIVPASFYLMVTNWMTFGKGFAVTGWQMIPYPSVDLGWVVFAEAGQWMIPGEGLFYGFLNSMSQWALPVLAFMEVGKLIADKEIQSYKEMFCKKGNQRGFMFWATTVYRLVPADPGEWLNGRFPNWKSNASHVQANCNTKVLVIWWMIVLAILTDMMAGGYFRAISLEEVSPKVFEAQFSTSRFISGMGLTFFFNVVLAEMAFVSFSAILIGFLAEKWVEGIAWVTSWWSSADEKKEEGKPATAPKQRAQAPAPAPSATDRGGRGNGSGRQERVQPARPQPPQSPSGFRAPLAPPFPAGQGIRQVVEDEEDDEEEEEEDIAPTITPNWRARAN